MLEGKKFIVYGDEGGSEGWAYGNISGTNSWGYVPISHVSTKNTISYYNSFQIGYPVQDESIKYISSPYGIRNSKNHLGFDITGGGSYIYGKNLVSPFCGEVVFVNKSCYDNNTKPSYGYCIIIQSNGGDYPENEIKDSVTGKHFTATFMHLSEAPQYRVGDVVNVGDVIGKIGNTGNVSGNAGVNPAGTHLHFEMNNMSATVTGEHRDGFKFNINPIFFYLNKGFEFNTGSSSYINNGGAYWYGNN